MEFLPNFLFIYLYVRSMVLSACIHIGKMGRLCTKCLPSLANCLQISLLYILECALSLYIVGGWMLHRSVIISNQISLSRWLLYSVGCFI